jgi:hypothetical protein
MAPLAQGRLRVMNADQCMAEGHAKFTMHAHRPMPGQAAAQQLTHFFLNAFPGCGI